MASCRGFLLFDSFQAKDVFAFAFLERAADLAHIVAQPGQEVVVEGVDTPADFAHFVAEHLDVAFDGRSLDQLFEHGLGGFGGIQDV